MKLTEIQQRLKVNKFRVNNFGKYKYRSCEDILEAVKPLLGKSKLTLSDQIECIGGRVYVKATASFTEDDSKEVTEIITAYAREAETKKGMDDAQITGSASSYARKYALCGLFLIDDGNDADSMNSHNPQENASHSYQGDHKEYTDMTPLNDLVKNGVCDASVITNTCKSLYGFDNVKTCTPDQVHEIIKKITNKV